MAVAGVNRPAQMLWPNPSPEGGGRVERSETGWGIARRLADGDAFAMTPHPAACGGHPPLRGGIQGENGVSTDAAETVLLTIFLRHDQSKNLDSIQGHLSPTDCRARFPPQGAPLFNCTVVSQ